jgi:hypothetical protein
MTAAQVYLDNHAARVHADTKTLAEVKQNIAFLKARIADDQSNLAAAEQFEGVLTKVIADGQRLLEEEWHEDWHVGRPLVEQPIEHKAMAATARTKSFPAVQVADPSGRNGGAIVCGHADCLMELIQENGIWLHGNTGMNICHPEAGPALQEGTDGDPTRRTVLPPHIAEEVRAEP